MLPNLPPVALAPLYLWILQFSSNVTRRGQSNPGYVLSQRNAIQVTGGGGGSGACRRLFAANACP